AAGNRSAAWLFGANQPQPDRQRLAEQPALLIALQIRDFFNHLYPVRRDRLGAQDFQYALPVAVIDIQSALAALASELRQAECPCQPFAVVAGLEREDGVEPAFH